MNANQRPDYYRCYRVLGLKGGCRWEQARRHYKLLSQRCHPDRYPNNPEARLAAEKKQRAVNLAMRMIADYYRKYGRMPIPDRPRLRPPEATGGYEDVVMENAHLSKEEKKGRKGWPWVLFLLFLGALSWWFWLSVQKPPEINRAVDASVAYHPLEMRRKAARFSFGDPPEVVRLIQGEPTAIKGDQWYFGRSVVYFKNGRVAGWLNHADSPLRADADVASGAGKGVIRIGSSRKEVLRIQGEPLFRGKSRWDYGPSYIEFQGGRVSGWYSSPLRPLRVKK